MQPPCKIEEELEEDAGSGTGDLKAVLLQNLAKGEPNSFIVIHD